ncbi:Ras GTPase-activating protein 2 [Tyrophagus putrescentiae]|nr:Ras GTPase-activating protein 2 [Tyrophagus putrescentiae]
MDQSYNRTDLENLNVRFVQQLKIRIGEAKNLQPKNGSNFLKDCFCSIKIDKNEELFQTHCSNEKTTHPFFGEEFSAENIPHVFRYLSVYLYEREKTVNTVKNRPLGKVTIRRSQLCKFSSEEAWFPLTPTSLDSEIQGKINLRIEPKYNFSSNTLCIIVNVIECQDLSECCDSHVAIELRLNDTIHSKRSKVKKKTSNPQYNESFYFEFPLKQYFYDNTECRYMCQRMLAGAELSIFVMHDSCGRSSNNFLGEIRIQMSKLELNESHKAWYFLQPKSFVSPKSNLNLGSLRLRLNYTSDYVFPSQLYFSLRNMLLSSIEMKPITSSTAYILGELLLNKADAAQPLVKIFLHYRKLVPLIRHLAENEISKVTDENLIFRDNSLVSKIIDELMKIVGLRYLHETLKSFVETVIIEQKCCEIDPDRIKEGSLESNLENLKQYISNVFRSITTSMTRCPAIMSEVFFVLKELAIKFFPGNKEVCYYIISSFVFLRYFAPAILNPRLFELTDMNIVKYANNPHIHLNFQNSAKHWKLGSFKKGNSLISKFFCSFNIMINKLQNNPLIKEKYMMLLYKEFLSDQYITKTKEFLELISSSGCSPIKVVQEPIILKEGIMHKISKHKRIVLGKAHKKRYFCITTTDFFYAKAKNKPPLYKFPIKEISVSKISDRINTKNMFQVRHNRCILEIQAKNCVQEKEWVDTLSKLIEIEQNLNCQEKLPLNGTVDGVFPLEQELDSELKIKLDP